MDFVSALKYPFNNSPKVLSIVLTLTILITICIVLIAGAQDWSSHMELLDFQETSEHLTELDAISSTAILGFLGLILLMIMEGFWINGYSIEVIRAVMEDNETMPAVEIGANLSRGFWIFLSGLWYAIVALVLVIAAVLLIGLAGSLAEALGGIAGIAAFILGIGYAFLAGWAYIVGLARFAQSGDRSALFSIRFNMQIAREHRGLSIRLSLFMIAFMLLYGFARSIVESLIGGLMGADIVVTAVIAVVSYHAFNLFQHFSTQHLIAQYGLAFEAAEYDMPRKNKPGF